MHPDLSSLTLYALGEPVLTPDETRHVTTCPQCNDEAGSLARTVSLVRGTEAFAEQSGSGPSPRVWDAVLSELGLSAAAESAPTVAPLRAPVRALPGDLRRPRQHGRQVRSAPVARPRGTRAWLPSLIAACIAGALGVSATAAWFSRPSAAAPATAAPATLSADLAPVSGEVSGSGQAQVSQAVDHQVLQVELDGVVSEEDDREVWLIDLDSGRMVSLGYLPADQSASFVVPDGLDLATYDVVDISAEPRDGNPVHSGVSLLRGSLAA